MNDTPKCRHGHFKGCCPVQYCDSPVSHETPQGLDFDKAERIGWVPSPLSEDPNVQIWDDDKYRSFLQAQHRALLAAAVEKARAEERVREYERLSAEYKTVAKALGVDGYGPEDFAEHIRTLNEEAP